MTQATATNVDIVRNLYAAMAAGDGEAVSTIWSPDIVWNEAENYPYADQNPYVGPAAIFEGVFGRICVDIDNFAPQMTDFIDGGDRVVVLGRYTGTCRETGQPLDHQAVHVWTIEDGKITKFQQYADTLGAARALGRI